MLTRVACAAVIGTGLFASSAQAETTTVLLSVGPDSSATVAALSDRPATSLQVRRGSTTVAQVEANPALPGMFDGLSVGRLELGDRIVVYENSAVIAEAAWTGEPTIESDACAGKTAFGVVRSPGASVLAGVVTPGKDEEEDDEPNGKIAEIDDRHVRVTVARPLVAGDLVQAATTFSLPQANNDTMDVLWMRWLMVPATCASAPPSDQGPGTAPAPRPSHPPFTDAQVKRAVLRALDAPRTKLRELGLARRKRIDLPFVFPEAGATRLELLANGRVVATGIRTRSLGGIANVTVRLSAAARRASKLTLRATFAPARAGGKPQRASVKVTLRRTAR